MVEQHVRVHDFGHLGVNACRAGGRVLGALACMYAGVAIGYGMQPSDGAVLKPLDSFNHENNFDY